MKLKLNEIEIESLSKNEIKLNDEIEKKIIDFDLKIILFEMLKTNL